jgi:hypothetical protein
MILTNRYSPIEHYKLEDDSLADEMEALSLSSDSIAESELVERNRKEQALLQYKQEHCPWAERGHLRIGRTRPFQIFFLQEKI